MNNKVKYIKREDDNFPKALESLSDCPDMIYVLGNEELLNTFSLAIIGARKCTPKGAHFAKMISKDLSKLGVTIVSGLAIGIDSAAHSSCIENDGKTIAVLGSGFNNLFPKQNKLLFENIIEKGGAVISEYMPDEYPSKIKFHNRNRIIAALSKGVIVIEAKEMSGSLVTINYAKKLNKKIFTIPGALEDINYSGSNRLLCDGANCIQNVNDVIRHYPDMFTKKDIKNIKQNEKNIEIPEDLRDCYDLLENKMMSIEEICNKTTENAKNILYKLTLLEMRGVVVKYPGNYYMKNI